MKLSPNFIRSRRTFAEFARRSISALATRYAPLSDRYWFKIFTNTASGSRRAFSGVISADIQLLRAWWERNCRFGHEYAIRHPHELTEYGRLVHFEFLAAIERLERLSTIRRDDH